MTDALLLLDDLKTSNHQCAFAYVCSTYPQLGLNWEFVEEVRTQRNAVNYKGKLISKEQWDQIKIELFEHIETTRKALKNRIRSEEEKQ
jgi:hypothetical protein